jgi:cell division septum initiation protein DivIVA
MRTKSKYDRFPVVKRGYDPEAVESHLTALINENDQTLDEAAAQIASLQTDLEESQKHEEAVHLTILAATKTKEDMLEVAQRQADEARAAGRKQGDGIITDARMQAFQVVTEARKEADDVVAEARAEVGALMRNVEASTTVADHPSESEVALQARIEEMQNVVAAMESELLARPVVSNATDVDQHRDHDDEQTIAETTVIPVEFGSMDEDEREDKGKDDSPSEIVDTVLEDDIEIVVTDKTPLDPSDDTTSISVDELDDGDGVDRSPDAAAPTDDGRITDDRDADAVRRSFYSRRSAKLPRIGVEAGRGAMAAAAGLRKGLTADEGKGRSDPDRSQEYETV